MHGEMMLYTDSDQTLLCTESNTASDCNCESLKVDIFLSACGNSGDEVFLVKILLMPTQICLGLLKD